MCKLFVLWLMTSSHQEERWSEDHSERDKRQAEWDFSKDSFFCDVPGKKRLRQCNLAFLFCPS